MRTPLQAWREFAGEFRAVMAQEEQRLLTELAPSDDQVARATERRAARRHGSADHTDHIEDHY